MVISDLLYKQTTIELSDVYLLLVTAIGFYIYRNLVSKFILTPLSKRIEEKNQKKFVNRGFDLIPSQLDLFRFEMAPGQGTENRLKNYLNYIRETDKYDFCIIDCPPTPSVWMTSALIASDFYLIPSKPDPISMTGLDLLEGIIKERKENYGCSCKCAGLVLTITESHTIVYKEAVSYFSASSKWKNYLYKSSVPKRVDIARGQLDGIFILDIDKTELNLSFSNVTQEFLRRVEGE